MAVLPDNRFVLPAPLIDFTNDVGETGQQHDSFPSGGQQARYDWFRMALIALLANQSSHHEPINYRAGSLWYDLHETLLKIRTGEGTAGSSWSSLADAIGLDGTTLAQWYTEASALLANVKPQASFSGHAASTTYQIPIPVSLQPDVSGRARTMAAICPPNPLAVFSAPRIGFARATSGVALV